MLQGMWGKKIGMTQVFSDNKRVVPVTLIDVSNWVVTQIKSPEAHGYAALQVGLVRPEYQQKEFDPAWLKKSRHYFTMLREIPVSTSDVVYTVGQAAPIEVITEGNAVDITGLTIGRGFQGAMKRHGFSGGRASHGDKLGRSPGSLSFMRRQGRVIKGKRMPGHMGTEQCVMKNLEIIRVEPESRVIFVKGSVPGKAGSLLFMRKK